MLCIYMYVCIDKILRYDCIKMIEFWRKNLLRYIFIRYLLIIKIKYWELLFRMCLIDKMFWVDVKFIFGFVWNRWGGGNVCFDSWFCGVCCGGFGGFGWDNSVWCGGSGCGGCGRWRNIWC